MLEYLRKKRKALSEGNQTLLATTCIDLAELYMHQGDYALAVKEYTCVAEAYKSLGMEMDYGRAKRMIGEAYMQLRQFDRALINQKIHLGMFSTILKTHMQSCFLHDCFIIYVYLQ